MGEEGVQGGGQGRELRAGGAGDAGCVCWWRGLAVVMGEVDREAVVTPVLWCWWLLGLARRRRLLSGSPAQYGAAVQIEDLEVGKGGLEGLDAL